MSKLVCGDGVIFFETDKSGKNSNCLKILNLNLQTAKNVTEIYDIDD